MAGICLCQFQKCPKSNNCRRYIDSKIINANFASYAEFKNICNESNNYQYFWEVKSNIKEGKNEK